MVAIELLCLRRVTRDKIVNTCLHLAINNEVPASCSIIITKSFYNDEIKSSVVRSFEKIASIDNPVKVIRLKFGKGKFRSSKKLF